jgi:hypothetical protein
MNDTTLLTGETAGADAVEAVVEAAVFGVVVMGVAVRDGSLGDRTARGVGVTIGAGLTRTGGMIRSPLVDADVPCAGGGRREPGTGGVTATGEDPGGDPVTGEVPTGTPPLAAEVFHGAQIRRMTPTSPRGIAICAQVGRRVYQSHMMVRLLYWGSRTYCWVPSALVFTTRR